MRIAVTSEDFQTVTAHAESTRRFLVFEASANSLPLEADRLDLPLELTMWETRCTNAHPLDAVDVVITGTFGDHLPQRLARRGVLAVLTQHSDPLAAINEFLASADAATLVAAAKTRLAASNDHTHSDESDCHHHGHDGCCCHEKQGAS